MILYECGHLNTVCRGLTEASLARDFNLSLAHPNDRLCPAVRLFIIRISLQEAHVCLDTQHRSLIGAIRDAHVRYSF